MKLLKIRKVFISFIGISIIVLLLANSCKKQEEKPNVILIMTDDQGYGDLSCHGSPYVKTPAIDGLYQESVRLTDFHVDPCCAPTRSALLTGSHSSRAGVWHTIGGTSLLKEGMTTIADLFQENDYETAIFGKWHLGENYPFRPQDRGFNEVLVHGGGVVGSNPGYWGNDYYGDTYLHNGEYQKYEGYCNTVWFNEALDYIEKKQDKPFFAFVSTNIPHAPLRVDEEYVEPHKDQVPERFARYYGMISKLDEDVSRFLDGIKEMGLKENTILIFMTDNGPCPWFGGVDIDFETGFVKEGYSAGMRGGKIYGFENAHRVPFFIQWPKGGISGGKDIDALSAHIDLMPTLIDLCNLKTPEDLDYDGKNLAPLLKGEMDKWPEGRTLFVHNQRVEYPVKNKDYEVLTEKWRLVKHENQKKLFNIQADSGQRNNIAGQHPGIVDQLYSDYEDWWKYISPSFDEFAKIHIGTEHENPVTLYSHDAHRRKGKLIWAIHVAREGKYEIRLNHWPEESGKRIVENGNGNKELPVEQANLLLGTLDSARQVTPDMTTAKFVMNLKAGETAIQTSLDLKNSDNTLSTRCVYVEYLGEPNEEALQDYASVDPDMYLRKIMKNK